MRHGAEVSKKRLCRFFEGTKRIGRLLLISQENTNFAAEGENPLIKWAPYHKTEDSDMYNSPKEAEKERKY